MSREPTSNNGMRIALIEAAARLIASEGAGGLTLRRLAEEVGTSTMAIYTHFGGMPELRRAVRREGFARLAERQVQLGESDDPVADLAGLAIEYYEHAISNPDLYRVMFMEQPLDDADADARSDTFNALTSCVQRCIDAGRFAPADARQLATRFWTVGHGAITLQMANVLSAEEALGASAGALLDLFVAWGDDPQAAREAGVRAAARAGIADRLAAAVRSAPAHA